MQIFKVKHFFSAIAIFIAINVVTWIINIVKLTDCDFKTPYRCEVLHGVGLFPPINVVTAWMSTDKSDAEQK